MVTPGLNFGRHFGHRFGHARIELWAPTLGTSLSNPFGTNVEHALAAMVFVELFEKQNIAVEIFSLL